MSNARLTEFQLDVARLFFTLPAAESFVLGGGAGLVAAGLTERPTQDLDFFVAQSMVREAAEQLEGAAADLEWSTERIRDEDTFVRLRIDGPEALLIDLCLDSPPQQPPTMTTAGPTYAADELAGRKVVALFSRAEARDFVDVRSLAERYGRTELLDLAATIDEGFVHATFATMLESLARFNDATLADFGADPAELRAWFSAWVDELRTA